MDTCRENPKPTLEEQASNGCLSTGWVILALGHLAAGYSQLGFSH